MVHPYGRQGGSPQAFHLPFCPFDFQGARQAAHGIHLGPRLLERSVVAGLPNAVCLLDKGIFHDVILQPMPEHIAGTSLEAVFFPLLRDVALHVPQRIELVLAGNVHPLSGRNPYIKHIKRVILLNHQNRQPFRGGNRVPEHEFPFPQGIPLQAYAHIPLILIKVYHHAVRHTGQRAFYAVFIVRHLRCTGGHKCGNAQATEELFLHSFSLRIKTP